MSLVFPFFSGPRYEDSHWGGSFADVTTDLIHSAFPWSAILPAAAVLSVTPSLVGERHDPQRMLGSTLALVVVFQVVVQGLLNVRMVTFPFTAITAVAGLSALAIERATESRFGGMRLVGVSVAATAIILLGDFENIPKKGLLFTGVSTASLSEALAGDYRRWVAIALSLVVAGASVVILAEYDDRSRPFSRVRLVSAYRRVRALCDGDWLSGLLVVETALGTTSLLVSAHERGFIYVPIFSAILPIFGAYLKYAWLLPLLLVVVAPVLFLFVREGASWLLSRDVLGRLLGIRERSVPGTSLERGRGHGRRSTAGVAAGTLGITLFLSGLCLTLGQMPRLIGQLSTKDVFVAYERMHQKGEPLALLGIGTRSARYYLREAPRSFAQFDPTATWLANGDDGRSNDNQRESRRFVVTRTDDFPMLNAAFRSKVNGRNLALLSSFDAQTVLVSNRADRELDLNPLKVWVFDTPKRMARSSDGEFGNAVKLEGWEIVDSAGKSQEKLKLAQRYRLRLGFRVLDPTPQDYRIFVHLEAKGQRQIGDHDPVSGLYPTSLWQPGDFIVDEYPFVLERNLGKGGCRLYVGFFQGSVRWDVTRGRQDEQRLVLDDVTIQ
ncbi:MAG: hypothetical protein QM784_12355 [Polyangiaceae bacterium]